MAVYRCMAELTYEFPAIRIRNYNIVQKGAERIVTKEEISKYAYKGIKPPDLTCLDEWLWYTLRDNYQAFRAGIISEQDGAEQKQSAMRRYEQEQTKQTMRDGIADQHATMWRRLEQTVNAYNADRTLQNADNIISTVYGIGVNG